ncbi:MAG: AAA family ATPase, partial [Methanobacteriota archaeon]
KVIAVSGKGGAGKTLVSTLIVCELAKAGAGSVLAIDADPDANLADSLGVTVEKTIGDLREEMSGGLPQGVEKRNYLEAKAFEITVESDGFDLISMGRPEGSGCYCALNHMLREVIDATTNAYDYTVIDAEAGLEHLSRRTTQNVDLMLVVTDASKKGLNTAKRVKDLARELEIEFSDIGLVLNRISRGNQDEFRVHAKESSIPVYAEIPQDSNVAEFDLKGKPLSSLPDESPSRIAVEKLLERIK